MLLVRVHWARRGSSRCRSRLCLGRGRELVVVNGHARRLVRGLLANVALVDGALLGSSHHLLRLGDVLAGSCGSALHGLVRVLSGDVAELLGLAVHDLAGVVKVRVDQILVLDVDEGCEVNGAGAEEQETPLGSDFDEEVPKEGEEEGL